MQTRFHNYRRPLVALDENARITSLITNSVYGGFDKLTPISDNLVSISHEISGIQRTNLNGSLTPPLGCTVTKQGTVVYEDEAIQVNVDFNPDATWRIDALVMVHIFIDSEGGAQATYAVLKAWDGTLTQYMTLIGFIHVPPLSNNHNSTRYQREDSKVLGGDFAFKKVSKTNLPWWGNETGVINEYLNDFNMMVNPGCFFVQTTTNRPSSTTQHWLVMIMRRDTRLTQFAIATNNGKVWARSGSLTGVTWTFQPWQNLNNADVPAVDLSPLWTAIGSRLYTDNNYVIDLESLTASIDSLDIVAGQHEVSISAALSQISSILTMLGDLAYDKNNIVTDGESITTSINKLDKSFSNILFGENLNSYIQPGIYYTESGVLNVPQRFWNSTNVQGILVVHKVTGGIVVQHFIAFVQNAPNFSRSFNGVTWGAWGANSFVHLQKSGTGPWNMDTTDTFNIPHDIPNGTWNIKQAFVKIRENSGNRVWNLLNAGGFSWDDTNFILSRNAGGIFDDPSCNSATVTVFYTIEKEV